MSLWKPAREQPAPREHANCRERYRKSNNGNSKAGGAHNNIRCVAAMENPDRRNSKRATYSVGRSFGPAYGQHNFANGVNHGLWPVDLDHMGRPRHGNRFPPCRAGGKPIVTRFPMRH
jgi:hypothetical protein